VFHPFKHFNLIKYMWVGFGDKSLVGVMIFFFITDIQDK
jgi:hypothetical protein